jgi:ATP-binding cassette subfamily B (MDR/TAP) protein 1
MESYSAAGTVAEEVISAIRTVFAFGGEAKEVERYEKNLFPAMKSGIRRNFATGLGNGITWACLYGGLALGIWFGVKLIIDSKVDETNPYTIGSIVIVFWCVSSCGWDIGNAAPHFEAIQMARGTAAIVFDIIERKPTIDSSSQSGDQLKNLEANIEFRDVHFSYLMRSDVKILNGFNLKIKCGETVALVGPSGCGKSTIIQLIQRFYDPTSGHVLIDGKDIKELNLGWIREQIGVVGQEPVLFDTSIIENIILGSCQKSIDRKDIEFAAIEANAHEFIMKLPEKYETYVGDRGTQLSGGQKQRIAIARALISKPKLLLLDEATSALDLQSEALVQTALDRASKGRTTIIVAHRLSTIINSDRIYFIDNGEVKETGSHTELMVKKGLYYNLVVAQQTQSKNAEDIEDYDENDSNIRRTTSIESDPMFAKDSNENNEPEEVLKRFSQMRLLRMLALDKLYVIIGLLCSILYSLVIPIYALIFGALIEVFAENTDNEIIWEQSIKCALYYIALAVGVCLTSVTQVIQLLKVGKYIFYDI